MAADELDIRTVDREERPIMQGSWRPSSARKKTRPDSGKARISLVSRSPSSTGSGGQRAESVEQRAESIEQIVGSGIGEANRIRSQSAASDYIRSLTSASLTSLNSPRVSESDPVKRRTSTFATLISVPSEELAIADLKREARRLRAIENEVHRCT
jgi:hypothetical protein